ncbi:hypothetical protein EPI10_031419 [Gossypium australe]|uniref:Uncharacterized protein n=1 Tax=Gossypium australe TaxID=47621 RepID=A0A5B6X3P3_9ROSI|nr:hypothetical protein EPI10_031419 [Gossypium australe]
MKPDEMVWNEGVVDSIFLADEAQLIKNLVDLVPSENSDCDVEICLLLPTNEATVEDVNHVLWLCAFALDVRAVLHSDSPPHEDQMGLHEYLSWMFDTYNTTKHSEIAITLWTLWYAHNKLVHEGRHQ